MIAAAYETAEDYTAIAEWLDQCVDGNVANTYMASLQEGLDGKSAEDIVADVQKQQKKSPNRISRIQASRHRARQDKSGFSRLPAKDQKEAEIVRKKIRRR